MRRRGKLTMDNVSLLEQVVITSGIRIIGSEITNPIFTALLNSLLEKGIFRERLIGSGKLGIHSLTGLLMCFTNKLDQPQVLNLVRRENRVSMMSALVAHHFVEVIMDKLEGESLQNKLLLGYSQVEKEALIVEFRELVSWFNSAAIEICMDGGEIPSIPNKFNRVTSSLSDGLLKGFIGRCVKWLVNGLISGDQPDIITTAIRLNLWGVKQLREASSGNVLFEEILEVLGNRYSGVESTDYTVANVYQAVEIRADSILTDVTMLVFIGALAEIDPKIEESLRESKYQKVVRRVIRLATKLIGIANDVGGIIPFGSDPAEIGEQIETLRSKVGYGLAPREALTLVTRDEEDRYCYWYSLHKDSRKGEVNLALDVGYSSEISVDEMWGVFENNLNLLQEIFSEVAYELVESLNLIRIDFISQGIVSFILYNCQIYGRGIDWDDWFDLESLPILSDGDPLDPNQKAIFAGVI